MTGASTTGETDDVVGSLVARVRALLTGPVRRRRVMVGVVGAPGAGKSTVTDAVRDGLAAVGLETVVVPMDGFHLAQRELYRLGRASRKGAPDTFDAGGYVALLRRLRAHDEDLVYAPEYVRGSVEQPVGSAIPVPREVPVVITEGNYLLLTEPPWSQLAGLLEETWYLDVDDDLRRERLYARHLLNGKPTELARAFTDGSDEANARLVAATRERADVRVPWS